MPPAFRALPLLALLVIVTVLRPSAVAAEPVAPALAAPIQGTLPNGLRYFVLPHATEPGRVSLRLLVHAGSLDERDDELGYAHFVEHMAFNGTRHYPPGELIKFFQKTGLAWGPDANADTTFASTSYRLDLPARHAAHVPEALQILRDYADGIEFRPAEVRREKGVVLSELRERATNTYQTEVQTLATLYRGTPLPSRLPIGTVAQIERATAAGLRAFYTRCYRPSRMTLVAVGDFDAAATQQLIAEIFSTLQGTDSSIAPTAPSAPPADGLHAHLIKNPLGTAAVVSLVAITPRAPDTAAGRELDRAQQIVTRALSRRQRDLRAQSPDRFGLIQALRAPGRDPRLLLHGLEAHTAAGDWAGAVTEIEHELRRARETGFTAAELAEAAATFLVDLRSFRDAMSGELPNIVANHVAALLLAGQSWQDPAEILAAATAQAARFTPADAAATLPTLFPAESLRLLIETPRPPAGGTAELLAAFHASAAQPLAAEKPVDEAPLEFRYTDFGPAGTVAQHRTEADLGVELVTFANGTCLNLRPSSTESNRFRLAARIGRGVADFPRDKPGLFLLSTSLLGRCDLGRHTREELGRIIRVRGVVARITQVDYQFLITLDGPTAELPFAFQFLTAFLSDVKLEPARLPQALSDYSAQIKPLLNSIGGFAQSEFIWHISNHDPRTAVTAPVQVANYTFEDVADWIRQRWLAGALEIGLTGDIDPATAISAASATVGTLPVRQTAAVTVAERLTLPAKPSRMIISRTAPAEKAAVVYCAWPAGSTTDTREFRALRFATDALIDRLRLQLREQRGATYAPSGGVERIIGQPDYNHAWLRLTFEPAKAQKMANLVNQLADELARRGVTEEEFARLAEPLRAQAAENLRSNPWWLHEVLIYAQTQPVVLADARSLPRAFTDLTRDEVNRAAATHLKLANAHGIGASPVKR